MSVEDFKIFGEYSKQILLSIADVSLFIASPFDRHGSYRKDLNTFEDWAIENKEKFNQTIYRLKKEKFINIYKKEKKKYIELTPKGVERLNKIKLNEIKIKLPKKWDKKWRIVIFDIRNDKKSARDALREKLKHLGFLMLQESVFIYPFECKAEIDYIVENYFIKHSVKYIVADILEGDEDLISYFIDMEILKPKMVK